MRIPAFKKLTLKEILEMNSLPPLSNFVPELILKGLDLGYFVMAPPNFQGASELIDGLEFGEPRVVILPQKYEIGKEKSDLLIKSLAGLAKIDSRPVLRRIAPATAQDRLSKSFLEEFKVRPETLIQEAMLECMNSPENPPAGGYWLNSFGEMSAWTWTRNATAAEMKWLHHLNMHNGKVVDTKFYGTNARVEVASRSTAGQTYQFSVFRMPLGRRGDLQPYSGWLNMKHNSPDPDTSYRGGEHDKLKAPIIFWSSPAVFGVFVAMEFSPDEQSHRLFRANPFGIPTKKMTDYIDKTRLKTLQLCWEEGKPTLRPTNMTEQDRLIGAKTMREHYKDNWIHHGKHDLSYLYQPATRV